MHRWCRFRGGLVFKAHRLLTPSDKQMARRGVLLLPVTAGYLGVAVWLAPLLGVRALILANILNMLLRTCVPALDARMPGSLPCLPGDTV